jgi:hypothetical protein
LRLLSNLETSRGKAIQIVLVAQPALLLLLRQSELAILRQRLTIRLHLDALDFHEAGDYMVHQLRRCGASVENIISDEVIAMLARHTSGVPRLLNQAGAQALALAELANAECVDIEVAMEALTSLGIQVELEASGDEFVPRDETPAVSGRMGNEIHSVSVTSGYPIPGHYTQPSELAGAYVYQPGQPVRMIVGAGG